MSNAPFDILKFFEAEEDEELQLLQVKIEDTWVDVPDTHADLDSTLLVVWNTRGVTHIAVKHVEDERVVEFDLRQVIVRDGSPLVTVERPNE
jgi:hypothetical protein